MRWTHFALVIAVLFSAAFSLPQVVKLEECESSVEFRATTTPSVNVLGNFASQEKRALSGSLIVDQNSVKGSAVVGLSSCTTPSARQSAFLKKHFLETDKYPNAELTALELVLPGGFWIGEVATASVPFKGILKLRDQTKPISGLAKVSRADFHKMEMDFSFHVQLHEYGLEAPNFMGIKTNENVEIKVGVVASLYDGPRL